MENNIVPRDKEDIDFIQNLRLKNVNDIRDYVPELLEWIQDGNWPQAKLIVDYFLPYVNEIESEIIDILKSDDPIWKYYMLSRLLYNSKVQPNNNILKTIKKLYLNANESEKEEEVDLVAGEVLNKFSSIQ